MFCVMVTVRVYCVLFMHDFSTEFKFCSFYIIYFVSFFLCLFDGLVSGILTFNDLHLLNERKIKRRKNAQKKIQIKISALWMLLWTKNEGTKLKCRYEGTHGHAPINHTIYIIYSSLNDFYLTLQLQCVYV